VKGACGLREPGAHGAGPCLVEVVSQQLADDEQVLLVVEEIKEPQHRLLPQGVVRVEQLRSRVKVTGTRGAEAEVEMLRYDECHVWPPACLPCPVVCCTRFGLELSPPALRASRLEQLDLVDRLVEKVLAVLDDLDADGAILLKVVALYGF
jgi:hypothetical protein